MVCESYNFNKSNKSYNPHRFYTFYEQLPPQTFRVLKKIPEGKWERIVGHRPRPTQFD